MYPCFSKYSTASSSPFFPKEILDNYNPSDYTTFIVNVHETSTGVHYDLNLIHEFCKKNNLFLIVDAISSFLADEINMTEMGIDVIITGSLGMHYMYQLTDEWHMHYLGLGITTGFELPISAGWTIVNRNFFSYDNANLGPNKLIQPFYASYQYHINLGVRYSRRVRNEYCYIGG